jgi:putative FmdB family regulatory protein
MPIYEYQCAECGERFEVRQSMGADGSKLKCPKCQAPNPQKRISSFFTQASSTSAGSELPNISCPTCMPYQ